MIELALVILCCWQLYRLAEQRSLSGWRWIGNFISGYFLFGLLLSFGLVYFYGADAVKDMKVAQELIKPFAPYALLFLVIWFLFIRSRILKYEEFGDDGSDDNFTSKPTTPETPPTEKKDLSYFR